MKTKQNFSTVLAKEETNRKAERTKRVVVKSPEIRRLLVEQDFQRIKVNLLRDLNRTKQELKNSKQLIKQLQSELKTERIPNHCGSASGNFTGFKQQTGRTQLHLYINFIIFVNIVTKTHPLTIASTTSTP
jgi:hypothetical protein